jgi:hypothetical protein
VSGVTLNDAERRLAVAFMRESLVLRYEGEAYAGEDEGEADEDDRGYGGASRYDSPALREYQARSAAIRALVRKMESAGGRS